MTRTIRGLLALTLAMVLAGVFVVARVAAAPQAPAVDPAAAPPVPTADPSVPNIFYGAQLPTAAHGPVIVFVHGLHGTAYDWFVNNDMYARAYVAGYRTAFVSLNADNTPNDAGIDENAAMLKTLLPTIVAHFGVQQVYMVGHSKGGVDIQGMLLYPTMPHFVRAVFTISTPNEGTELADWAFGPGLPVAGQFNLLTPGVFAMQTARMAQFRSIADPVLKATGIPFFTMEGSTAFGNPVTEITGGILKQLVPGEFNDGVVTVPRATLPADYSADLGTLTTNHFMTDNGYYSFAKIDGEIEGLETELQQFNRVAVDGLGDEHNTWAWSMQWYKGQLYVGTGREVRCVSLATSDATQGTKTYPIAVFGKYCPDFETLEHSLAAEIWRYTPQTKLWQRVYKSPETIPMGPDSNGNPILIGRDVGFRGMTVYTESDGSQWLYVGGVTAGSVFGVVPPYSTLGFPPPRLLRTQDGVNWQVVPETPGTFLGNISQPRAGSSRHQYSFRGLTPYQGKLFATVSDFRGVGLIIASDNPSAGDNAWYQVTGKPEDFPVWNITVFNNYLYATTGDKALNDDGLGLYKTDASGTPPYQWTPIITNGGYQPDPRLRAPDGLSFMQFKGQLYMGTNRPTEMYRINPDDTWDLIVGEPRMTPQGFKAPLSGLGIGFGSWFTGHFWRMGATNDQLFLGTWDWSVLLRFVPSLDHLFSYQYGFDFLRTSDGIHWHDISRTGMNDPNNFGGRSFATTPFGVFLGTARPQGGAQVFQCMTATCAEMPTAVAAPQALTSVSQYVAGRQAILSWDAVPGAVRYRVYRATVKPITDFLGGSSFSFTIPGTNQTVTLQDIQNGALDGFCTANLNDSLCSLVDMIKAGTSTGAVAGFPLAFEPISITSNTQYSEQAPTDMQSLYYVRSEDADGNLSPPSNFVGAPSKALPGAPPTVTPQITPPPNAAGWNNTPVQVTWTVSDNGDPIISPPCPPVTLSAETAGTPATCVAVSGSGARTTQTVTVKIDMTPPTIAGDRTPAANGYGWNNTDVTVSFTCDDALSGVATCGPTLQVVSAEGANQSRTATAVDQAGNTTSATVGGISIDKTPPFLSAIPDPQPNVNGWNNTNVTVGFAASDALSGIATVSPPTTLTAEGAGQVVAGTATDKAGNTASVSLSVNIDKTPPEAIVHWDPVSHDIVVEGQDALSGPSVSGILAPGSDVPVAWHPDNDGDSHQGHESEEGHGGHDDHGGHGKTGPHGSRFARLGRSFGALLTAGRSRGEGGVFRGNRGWDAFVIDDAGRGANQARRRRDDHASKSKGKPQPQKPKRRDDHDGDHDDQASQRTYTVSDLADNTLTLVLVARSHGHETQGYLVSFGYDGATPTVATDNRLKFEWSQDKAGAVRELEQQIATGEAHDRQSVQATFDLKKNLTWIMQHMPGMMHADHDHDGDHDDHDGSSRVTQQGLFLIRLASDTGQLQIQFN